MKLSRYPALGIILSQILILAIVCLAGPLGFYIYVGYLAFLAIGVLLSFFRSSDLRPHVHFHERHERMLRITARIMLLFLFTGAILYSFAIRLAYPPIVPNAELVARSLRCSLDLFALNLNTNILDRVNTHLWLKGLIAVQGGLSIASSVALLFSLVFTRLRAWYQLHRRTSVSPDRNKIFIFFGMDDNSRLLARRVSESVSGAMCIFVESATPGSDDSTDSWTGILNIFTHRRRTFVLADEAGALVAIASRTLRTVEHPDNYNDCADILGEIGLARIASLISTLRDCPEDARLEIFFLSDNEDDNIRDLMTLARDTTIRRLGNTRIPHRISVRARRNGPNRVIEDLAVKDGLKVEIVDSSELAVTLLKANPATHPVRVAALSPVGPVLVEEPLEALVVGFGEVGRDAFRFIYEFGTFIGAPDADGIPATLQPRITAVDSRMSELEGRFRAGLPGVDFESGLFRMLQLDSGQEAFYSDVLSPDNCRKLNYIVISTDDSDVNIDLAVVIFNRIRRFRADMSRLIIAVRCVSDADIPKMQKVAEHFNFGRSDTGSTENIVIFGAPTDIYTVGMLVDNRFVNMGRRFNENYRLIRGGENWDERELSCRKLIDREGLPSVPDIDRLRSLRRKTNQDTANAFHAATKLALMPDGFRSRLPEIATHMFRPDGSSTIDRSASKPYPALKNSENVILSRLAILEHARWNAAHELLGYLPWPDGGRCDERTLRHNCLVPWSDLDDAAARASYQPTDYKSYDYAVVETTIKLECARKSDSEE
ncbi:MAG: hypothetical protein K2L96_04190 [Muribaculaceae bacterium]|nr:hypothetical protein [Muribaculaceae bacterium]